MWGGGGGGGGLEDVLLLFFFFNPGPNFARKKYLGQG